MRLLKKIFGSRNERLIRRMGKTVAQINALEPQFQKLSETELRAKTDEFKKRLADGETLESLLPEAFAAVREASVRTLKLRHFDVQLIGGMVLDQHKIAEMRTGEGKTLVSTLPAYLNALTGRSVHIVTVNDYLAKRDAAWMEPIYNYLGMTVGVNLADMQYDEKQAAYNSDITYGTNNEFGFDYLRDNMIFARDRQVQRSLHYAIVDEVDSILIDEARTPLVISGPAEAGAETFSKIYKIVSQLEKQKEENGPGDYSVDEKNKQAFLTEDGHQKAEDIFVKEGLLDEGESLYDSSNIMLMHHLNACIRAQSLFQKDVDYIVKDNEVVIVDEHTGRLMPGRRWSDGLHQAMEAKENVEIHNENQTLASITFQNYFRLYEKLSGMTGTADTEAFEFMQIYGLEVVVIPTNQSVIRDDNPDMIYLNLNGKYKHIIEDIKHRGEKGQPVLVGTASIESSERLSRALQTVNIPHQVLNAKYHEKEAKIIAQAGRPGTVTIATNMAGRGTDIVLGGNVEAEVAELENPSEDEIKKLRAEWQERHNAVVQAGGLYVLGTERNESRRIDNQLRGRSGRQGDPGASRFYLSLDDSLMRIFASDRMKSLMSRLGMEEDTPIENKMVTRAIENAQRKVEGHNFDIRKQLLQFDDVANDQRKVIYSQRQEIMESADLSDSIQNMIDDVVDEVVSRYIPPESIEDQWDVVGLEAELKKDFECDCPIKKWLDEEENLYEETLRERIKKMIHDRHEKQEKEFGSSMMRQLEQSVMLQAMDLHWKEHLAAMDYLRQGIHLRGYAQRNPTQEYKREAFDLFTSMLSNIKLEVINTLCVVQLAPEQQTWLEEQLQHPQNPAQMEYQHSEVNAMAGVAGEAEYAGAPAAAQPAVAGTARPAASGAGQALGLDSAGGQPYTRGQPKVGRNDPCPCGSGKKFKQCHGHSQ